MLLKDIRAIAGEAFVLSPDDKAAETTTNTTWFSAPPHERMGLTAEEVVTAFEETAELLRDQVALMGHTGLATFYVWHDQQAGQLRCSIRSCGRDELPFEQAYRPSGDLAEIVTEFLEDRAPGAIVWGQLEPVPFTDLQESVFTVWVFDLKS